MGHCSRFEASTAAVLIVVLVNFFFKNPTGDDNLPLILTSSGKIENELAEMGAFRKKTFYFADELFNNLLKNRNKIILICDYECFKAFSFFFVMFEICAKLQNLKQNS